MMLLIGVAIGYVLCLLSLGIVFAVGESAHVDEHPFSDDPRPALLRDQAE